MEEQTLHIIVMINRCITTVCIVALMITAIIISGKYATQVDQKSNNRYELESYYTNELESLFIKCYKTDENHRLIWSQHSFETARNTLREQMLADGFNRGQIQSMENIGRAKGQEIRRLCDNL